jgi:hypothetical protein
MSLPIDFFKYAQLFSVMQHILNTFLSILSQKRDKITI